MARPLKWAIHVHRVLENARKSNIQTWRRSDIEALFEVERVTAQNLVRAIGGVTNIARNHLIDRAQVIEFLEEMAGAPDIEQAFRDRLQRAENPPEDAKLLVPLPSDLRNVRFHQLASFGITVAQGRCEITGSNGLEILQRIGILLEALKSDYDVFMQVWNKDVDMDAKLAELRALFGDSGSVTVGKDVFFL